MLPIQKRSIAFPGFTLVELLIVMSIIGVLATLIGGNFLSAQIRGRDAQRKSDLKNISQSLEIFFSDYNKYPNATGTQIEACPYNPAAGTGSPCSWGVVGSSSEFSDGKTTYIKVVPKDPTNSQNYVYRIVPGSNNQKYQLFSRIENSQDSDCINDNCTNPVSYSCGTGITCNFAITSTNTNAIE